MFDPVVARASMRYVKRRCRKQGIDREPWAGCQGWSSCGQLSTCREKEYASPSEDELAALQSAAERDVTMISRGAHVVFTEYQIR